MVSCWSRVKEKDIRVNSLHCLSSLKSPGYRIKEPENGLDLKNIKDHLFPSPHDEQGHLPLNHIAQAPIQPGPEHFQAWGINICSVQRVPVPHPPLPLCTFCIV